MPGYKVQLKVVFRTYARLVVVGTYARLLVIHKARLKVVFRTYVRLFGIHKLG